VVESQARGQQARGQALHLTSIPVVLGCDFKQEVWMARPCGEMGGRSGRICQT